MKLCFFFQPEAVRMTILGRLTTLTHLDDMMVAEEEAADAVQMAAGSKINQVKILQIPLVAVLCESMISKSKFEFQLKLKQVWKQSNI